ncbi:unnamed protein product [Protopolystoma xenopodis]|uniref:Uncharacterized protein n=1 Tax=Protopolystoma xenopodis TaxID=117903 RepID=A0A3S5CDT4_9PLAT|nr:unnamed protein product [Protopolystoma xenopodis]
MGTSSWDAQGRFYRAQALANWTPLKLNLFSAGRNLHSFRAYPPPSLTDFVLVAKLSSPPSPAPLLSFYFEPNLGVQSSLQLSFFVAHAESAPALSRLRPPL